MRDPRARRRRAGDRGFTLIELMVVIVLVAVLAAVAAPSFSNARDDRTAFDYARQYQQILVQGRARAAGTGSAHLALLTPGTGGRGAIRLYAALDGATTAGPNPVASCKANIGQWVDAIPEPTDYRRDRVLPNNLVRFIDYADINRPGVNETMDLRAALSIGDGNVGSANVPTAAVAVCITPSGVTYVGSGASAAAAVAEMRAATPFTGIAEVQIRRHRGGAGVGLTRRLTIAGGGAPRLRSE